MKLGDLVRLHPCRSYVNLYEGDDLNRIENGERFYRDDVGLVLKSMGEGNHTHFKVLSPSGAMGWIHNFHLELVR